MAERSALDHLMFPSVGASEADEGWTDRLKQGLVANFVRSALDALMLPGDVSQGKFNTASSQPGMWSDVDEARAQLNDREAINRTVDLAGAVMGGAYAAPRVHNSIGMGVRTAPQENYTVPLSKYTDRLYRETSPEAALEVLPHSNVSAGYGPMGAPTQFYADTPDLALGQGANKGVRIGYDASAFEGQINQSKPAWQPMFESGSAEYLAAPVRGTDIRNAARSVSIDRAALAAAPRVVQAQIGRMIEKMKSSGWDASDSKEYLDLVRKYGLAGSAGPLAALMLGDQEAQVVP